MELCDICRERKSYAAYESMNSGKNYHRFLPRVRSENFFACKFCISVVGKDADKYRAPDYDTRLVLSKYDPLPRRKRLILKELSFHKNLDRLIAEYSL